MWGWLSELLGERCGVGCPNSWGRDVWSWLTELLENGCGIGWLYSSGTGVGLVGYAPGEQMWDWLVDVLRRDA